MKRRFRTVLVTALTFVGMIIGVQPAAAGQDITCDSGFGAKVPVLMVHGFNSSPRMWGELDNAAMERALKKIEGVHMARAFDYESAHNQWVTDPRIGPKLASTIDCLARTSLKGGGKGKVIVVAHSMGGLAARFAANQTIDGRRVADQLGLVVTLGTPHLGSLLANAGTNLATSACQGAVTNLTFNPLLGILMTRDQCLLNLAIKGLGKSSKELASLPHFPPNVPVRAIAGNANVYVPLLFTQAKIATDSDLVVGKSSAIAEAARPDAGGGAFVFGCDVHLRGLDWQGDGCTHTVLPNTEYIQQSVREGIQTYIDSISAPAVPMTDIFGLGLPLGAEWDVLGPDEDTYHDIRRVIIRSGCQPRDPMSCGKFVIVNLRAPALPAPYTEEGEKPCITDWVHDNIGWSDLEPTGKVTVDGVEGEHLVQRQYCRWSNGEVEERSVTNDTMHSWRFDGVLVYDLDIENTNPDPEVEQLLKNARWQ